MRSVDIVVIGGGMAGAAAAHELARDARVTLVEREAACGYHATGRSAASFTENYGPPVIRRLALASRAFLTAPPDGFADQPLLTPRGMLTIARADQMEALEQELSRALEFVPTMRRVTVDEALDLVPALRRDYVAGAILEPHSRDIDVHALHQGFLKGLRARGGAVVIEAEVTALARAGRAWRVATRAGDFACAMVINAAGAWADRIAALAGIPPVGLVPKRRTAFHVPAPADMAIDRWPLVNDVGGEFYFKPDAGKLFVSPADATPSEPVDAQADELDVAIGADRLQRATTIEVRRVTHRWAGLRTFARDGAPVVGPDADAPGFFWLAGQGGYGIKTAWALARATASLIAADDLPEDQRRLGLKAADLAPGRLRGDRAAAPPVRAAS